MESRIPAAIEVRGARVHTLRDLDLDLPLNRFVAITGLSGSGKSSLAMGVLYAEGARRYLDALSTYTRRRIEQAARPDVDRVSFLPAAVAVRQRPQPLGNRSTVGTASEVFNVLRLVFSRLGSHVCPNGHRIAPAIESAMAPTRECPVCAVVFELPSAESFAFNGLGACPRCTGDGFVNEVIRDALVPDPSLTIEDGAVVSWRGLRKMIPYAAAGLGVRIDVPFADLTDDEHAIVMDGPAVQQDSMVPAKSGRIFSMKVGYLNAVAAAYEIANADNASAPLVQRLFTTATCPACKGTRLRPEALGSLVEGQTIAEVSARGLAELPGFADRVRAGLPAAMQMLGSRILDELVSKAAPLLEMGLGYLTLDRAGPTLSTGERQRIELSTAVTNRSTGMLFVLDEPTVGLHPVNVDGVLRVVERLVADGNSVVVVDHDVRVLQAADWLVELGPGAGREGGAIVAVGSPAEIAHNPTSRIAPHLRDEHPQRIRPQMPEPKEWLEITIAALHNLSDVHARFPVNRLTAVTGVSGAGKTALVLDSLVPAVGAPPAHVTSFKAAGIDRVVEVDATPIGRNPRSTPATYSGVFDTIRRMFAQQPAARERGWTASHFSYNNADGRCPLCEGLGELSLDVQFLADIPMTCPECHGSRYLHSTLEVTLDGRSIRDVLSLSISEAAEVFGNHRTIGPTLKDLVEVGLGYLTLGESTVALSGGEAQRLRLASRLRQGHEGLLLVFDEPSIGLHPDDVRMLLDVFQRLLDQGATIIVIEHDRDVIANADYVVDLGPGGGRDGGKIVAQGTPEQLRNDPASVTGPWL